MFAESHKDFSNPNSDKKQNVILSPFSIEKKTEKKILVPLNKNTAENQTIIQTKKKRRPKKIIVIETPISEKKNKMKKVYIRYKDQPKTVVQKIQSEKPVSHGQKTLSLIRNTPKYRPVILVQPQPYFVTQFALPLVKVPVFRQNIQDGNPILPNQKMAPNQIKSLPHNLNQSGPNRTQYFRSDNLQGTNPINNPGSNFIQPKNGQMINAGPGYKNYISPNGTKRYCRNNQRIIKNDSEQDNSENAPSPFLLFHDHDDENEAIKKGDKVNNDESLNNQSEETIKNRHEAKSKFGRNKLDFISNLFDGYYYTNIDYEKNDTDNENNPNENIEPLEQSTIKEANFLNLNPNSARYSSRLTNSTTLPPINKKNDSFGRKQVVSGMKKSDYGQVLPPIDATTKSVNYNYNSDESLSQVSPSLKDETRTKSSFKKLNTKKSNNSDGKNLNYPRNTVLTNY